MKPGLISRKNVFIRFLFLQVPLGPFQLPYDRSKSSVFWAPKLIHFGLMSEPESMVPHSPAYDIIVNQGTTSHNIDVCLRETTAYVCIAYLLPCGNGTVDDIFRDSVVHIFGTDVKKFYSLLSTTDL